MMKRIDIDEVASYIAETSESTRIYIGSDSSRFRSDGVWYAEYATVVVVHRDGKHGCRIFGDLSTERDYDQRRDKPRLRLMNEVIRTANVFLQLEEAIGDRHVEIHLDINPDERYGSSCVVQEAIGYIRGMCNVVPMVKPRAFAASIAADRLLA
jgi:predicted RNase H-related nuclease YkuK (DUF458 family)